MIGYVWQDALLATLFAVIEYSAGQWRQGRRVTAVLYWVIVVYAAINVPVARVLSTPLDVADAAGDARHDCRLDRAVRHVAAYCRRAGDDRGCSRSCHAFLTPFGRGSLTVCRRGTAHYHRWSLRGGGSRYHRAPSERGARAGGERAATRRSAHLGQRLGRASLRAAGHRGPDGPERVGRRAQRRRGDPRVDGRAISASVRRQRRSDAATGWARAERRCLRPGVCRLSREHPGLFSVLCSRFPAFDMPPEAYAAPCPSIAAMLGRAGYRTGMFHSGRFGYLGMESVIRERGFHTLEDAGDIGGHHESSFGVDEPSAVARMLTWIDRLSSGERFFITYLPIAGHHPYATPERGPFADHDEMGRYRNAIRYGDESLGALMDGLRHAAPRRANALDRVWRPRRGVWTARR